MNQNFIFFPCLAMLVLSFIVAIRMFLTRVSAVKTGNVEMKYFKTYDGQNLSPALMTQASRNFTNLFEVPTLFYMVCAFALITQNVDFNFYMGAWLFAGLRCIHSMIHVTHNKIYPRMTVFMLSCTVLFILAIYLGFNILKIA